MSQILSQNSHDYLQTNTVPVIASFDDDGHVKPLYIGINGERCKVISHWVRRSFMNQIEFQCKVQYQNMLKPIVVTYYMTESVWMVPNRV